VPFPNIDPIALQLGPLAIRWYALGYLAGVFLGAWYATTLLKREHLWADNKPPFPAAAIWDFAFWAVIGIVLGGRLGYVLFYNLPYYSQNPGDIIALWDGGMSFHGGLIGIMVAKALFTVSHNRKSLQSSTSPLAGAGRGGATDTSDAADTLAIRKSAGSAILQSFDLLGAIGTIGLFFGRVANFINAELYGAPTTLPWGVVFPTDPDGLPRHPTQLYEAGLEGVLLFLIVLVGTRYLGWLKRPGLVAGIFGVGYSLGRILVEFWRLPDIQLGYLLGTSWLTMGMVLSLPILAAGIALIAYAMARPRG
jgi:phosphatidylglycerol:prolipoprotein diacylglycerol transferase